MVVLSITMTEDPCTVFFDRPIPKADHVGIISCTLCNSWLKLKTSGIIKLFNAQNRVEAQKRFPPGHYTPKGLAKALNLIFKEPENKIPTEAKRPAGALVIKIPENRKLQFAQNLSDFLGINFQSLMLPASSLCSAIWSTRPKIC